MTIALQKQPGHSSSTRPTMSTEEIAVAMRDTLHLDVVTSDEEYGGGGGGRSTTPSTSKRFGPPMEIVIVTPPDSPHAKDGAPPPPPPFGRSSRRRGGVGVGANGGKVEAIRPSEANKVLGFTDRGKTAVAKLFTKIPVVSAQGAGHILARRMRNAKAREQQQQQHAEEKPISSNGSCKSGRSSVLAKAANFLTHSMSGSIKSKQHARPVVTPSIPKSPPVIIPAISPQQLLDRIHVARGYSVQNYVSLHGGYHSKPTELQQASYGTKMVEAVRTCDPLLLRRLLQAGLSPNPCNAYGESLLHMVCRRGDLALLHEMMNAGCSFQVTDDFGRTPLHDACWTTAPNFELISEILSRDLRLFRILDCRGSSPLSYIKKDYWVQWIQFFHSTINRFWPPRDTAAKGEEEPPPLTLLPPNSRPIPDPPNALPIDLATMVSNGRRDPSQVVREHSFRLQRAQERSFRLQQQQKQFAREQSLRLQQHQQQQQQLLAKEQLQQQQEQSLSSSPEKMGQVVPEPVEVTKPGDYPHAECDDEDDDSDSISTNTSASSTYSSSCSSSSVSSLDDEEDDD